MTTVQLFFALTGTYIAVVGLLVGILIKYLDARLGQIDAKLDPIKEQVDLLVQYMISHEGRIATLEERTKGK